MQETTWNPSEKLKPLEIVGKGVYRHYKGGYYNVLAVGTHTETGQALVVYNSVNDTEMVWCRPVKHFCSRVEINSKSVMRFEPVEEESI